MAEDRQQPREGGGADERRPRSSDTDLARYRGERARAKPGAGPIDRVARPGAARGYDTK